MLDSQVRDELRKRAREALARKSFLEFNVAIDPDFDPTARHAIAICEHLDALARREIENLMLFMPPQVGKSTYAAQRFPSYLLGITSGKMLVATTSYTIDIARKNSRLTRKVLLDRSTYPFESVTIDPRASAVDEWYTTAGGGVKAAGVGGSLTGFGANLIVTDDPFKGMAEAESLTIRDATWEWYQSTVSTRRRRGTQKLLAQTRWHEDDLAGRILNSKAGKKWTVLTLRAFAEDDDPLGRKLGEVLWPDGPVPLSVADGEISSRAFSALYQQRPVPASGTLFKRAWFNRRYSSLEALPRFKRAALYVDGAWKEGVAHDRSAIGLWATDEIDWYLVDAWAARVEYPDLKAKLADYWNRWRTVAPLVVPCVEDAASGIPIIQEFRRSTNIPIVGVAVDKSKFARAEAVTPCFESGKVVLPESAPWLDEWIEEHLRFPGGKHDDYVDTTSGALARLRSPGKSTWSFAVGKNR